MSWAGSSTGVGGECSVPYRVRYSVLVAGGEKASRGEAAMEEMGEVVQSVEGDEEDECAAVGGASGHSGLPGGDEGVDLFTYKWKYPRLP